MKIPITDAKGRLTDLVRRAEAGDEVILTRRGHAAVRLVPVAAKAERQVPPGAAGKGQVRGSTQGERRPERGGQP